MMRGALIPERSQENGPHWGHLISGKVQINTRGQRVAPREALVKRTLFHDLLAGVWRGGLIIFGPARLAVRCSAVGD
jgi:hypothetical protein